MNVYSVGRCLSLQSKKASCRKKKVEYKVKVGVWEREREKVGEGRRLQMKTGLQFRSTLCLSGIFGCVHVWAKAGDSNIRHNIKQRRLFLIIIIIIIHDYNHD